MRMHVDETRARRPARVRRSLCRAVASGAERPDRAIRSPRIATSPENQGLPVPSTIVPPRIRADRTAASGLPAAERCRGQRPPNKHGKRASPFAACPTSAMSCERSTMVHFVLPSSHVAARAPCWPHASGGPDAHVVDRAIACRRIHDAVWAGPRLDPARVAASIGRARGTVHGSR